MKLSKKTKLPSRAEKLAAVRKLAGLRLPVAHPRRMKQQAVPQP